MGPFEGLDTAIHGLNIDYLRFVFLFVLACGICTFELCKTSASMAGLRISGIEDVNYFTRMLSCSLVLNMIVSKNYG